MENIKYIYIPVIIVLIIVLIIFIKSLAKLMKKTAGLNDNINKLKNNIDIANNKVEDIKQTKQSWQFFFTIYIVYSILKETVKDYKKSSKHSRGIAKSFSKTCVKNASKLSKIKIK